MYIQFETFSGGWVILRKAMNNLRSFQRSEQKITKKNQIYIYKIMLFFGNVDLLWQIFRGGIFFLWKVMNSVKLFQRSERKTTKSSHLRTYFFLSRKPSYFNLKLGMSSKMDIKLDGNHCDISIFLEPFLPFFLAFLGQFWVVFWLRGVLNIVFT